MGRQEIQVEAHSSAPLEAVFSIVADGARWPTCTPLGSFTLERFDADGNEGPGAMRVFSTGPFRTREQVVEVTPPRHFSYVMVSGLPIRNYRADIDLEARPDGTLLHWRAAFEAKVPGTGWLFRSYLKRFLQQSATGIAAAASAD